MNVTGVVSGEGPTGYGPVGLGVGDIKSYRHSSDGEVG